MYFTYNMLYITIQLVYMTNEHFNTSPLFLFVIPQLFVFHKARTWKLTHQYSPLCKKYFKCIVIWLQSTCRINTWIVLYSPILTMSIECGMKNTGVNPTNKHNKGPLKVSYLFIYTHMYIYYTFTDFSLYKSQLILFANSLKITKRLKTISLW